LFKTGHLTTRCAHFARDLRVSPPAPSKYHGCKITTIMVRLKHRYLLINILYPNPPNTTSKSVPLPHVIQFNRPTSDQLTPQLLLKLIRDGVQELYGDYGSGMISASLKGVFPLDHISLHQRNFRGYLTSLFRSELSFHSYINGNCPRHTVALQTCLGCTELR